MSIVHRFGVIGLSTALLIIVAPGAAHAQSQSQRGHTGAAVALQGMSQAARTSDRFAGYAGPGGDSGAEVRFAVPELACAAGEDSSELKSVIAFEQFDGTRFINGGGGVYVICDHGVGRYAPVLFDSLGEQISVGLPVEVGDRIRVRFSSDSVADKTSSSIRNLTQKASANLGPFDYFETTDIQIGNAYVTFADGGPDYLALDRRRVASAGSPFRNAPQTLVISQFKPVSVDGAKINESTGLKRFNLVDDGGEVIAKTSTVAKHGFTVRPV